MSCSKDSAAKYLIDKNLVKPNMELYSPIPSDRLLDTIEYLTNLAKNKYKVDMGELFKIRHRDVQVGSYILLGNASTVTKARLEANDAAFDAIDLAKQQTDWVEQREIEERRTKEQKSVEIEYQQIQEEGNYIVSEDGEIQVPSYLPKINVRC